MAPEVDTITAPAFWASYLVNGDASGLSPRDLVCVFVWRAKQAPWRVVSTVEGSERYTSSYRLHGGDAEGGEVLDYIVHKVTEDEGTVWREPYVDLF